MKSVTQGSSQTNERTRDQRQVAARVLALLATVLGLTCSLGLVPKHRATDSGAAALSEGLPPYWAWLEAEESNGGQAREWDRPVYAYSVIPGGVATRAELRQALAHDSVAASHYSGFHVAAAHPIWLERARQVYVSYRLGNRTYWTSKKVTLRAGELLLSDGANLVRSRCGNRISEVPLKPTAPTEPAEPVLNAPVLRRDALETTDWPAPPPSWTENPTPFLLAMAPPVSRSPAPGSAPFVPPFPVVPCCAGGLSSQTPTPPPTPPIVPPGPAEPPPIEPSQPPGAPPPVVPASEPQTLEMLVVALASLIVIAKLRRN